MGAALCCRATGATAGRLSAYLLERCGSEAAQLCAHLCTARRLAAQVSRFFVSKVSEAPRGGVGGTLEEYGLGADFTTLRRRAQSLLFGLAYEHLDDVYAQNERRCSCYSSSRRTCWLLRGLKRAQTQLTKELYWSSVLTSKRAQMIQSQPARPALRRASAAEFAVPPRRASAPEFG